MRFVPTSGSAASGDSPSRADIIAFHRRMSPPENEAPGVVPFAGLLAQTESAAVAVLGLSAYSTGLAFAVEMRLRREPDRDARGRHAPPFGYLDSSQLLLGVEFADGRRATTRGSERFRPGLYPPEDKPLLVMSSGSGGGRSYSQDDWLTPYPSAGDLLLVVAWPEMSVAEQRVTIPASALTAGRERVIELWPWEPEVEDGPRPEPALPPVPGGGWFAETVGDDEH